MAELDTASITDILIRCVNTILIVFLYFLPFIIALIRKHKHKVAIFVLNLFFAIVSVCWFVLLIWSFLDTPIKLDVASNSNISQELKNLSELTKQGILTEKEFEYRKKKLLKK